MSAGPPAAGAVIFDRDGTLNVDVGYAVRPDQIRWVPDAARAVRAVNEAGLLALVATNQSGVARGFFEEADVRALHAWMADELARAGARIDAFAYCPHHPEAPREAYRRACACRKPAPGLILDLLAEARVPSARAVFVGDQDRDGAAAAAAGVAFARYGGGSLLALVQPIIARLAPATLSDLP